MISRGMACRRPEPRTTARGVAGGAPMLVPLYIIAPQFRSLISSMLNFQFLSRPSGRGIAGALLWIGGEKT